MRFLVSMAVVMLWMVAAVVCGHASDDSASQNALGERLLKELWEMSRNRDIPGLEKMLAKGFQSVHQDGAHDRDQEIKLLKKLKLGEYKLSNIKVTRNGPVIVVTYLVRAPETIHGERLSAKAAPRLTVFLKTDAGWQWMAHANLKAIK